jgi:hypothetical protein
VKQRWALTTASLHTLLLVDRLHAYNVNRVSIILGKVNDDITDLQQYNFHDTAGGKVGTTSRADHGMEQGEQLRHNHFNHQQL